MLKKKTILLAVFILAITVSLVVFSKTRTLFQRQGQANGAVIQQPAPQPIHAVGFEYGDLIKETMVENKSLPKLASAQIGITSHHLPTAVSFIAQFYNTLKQAGSPHQTFVIIGPDHYEHCKRAVSTTKRPYYTPFGILDSNSKIINDLEENGGVVEVDSCFDEEHSIGVQSMFVKFLYPDSTIVPLVYSSAASDSVVEKVAQVLARYKEDITVIVSVDFSHAQSTQVANQLDKDSGAMIEHLDGSGLVMRYTDSPASIKTAISLSKLWNLKPHLLQHANSFDFTGQSENTTGYWDILFAPKK